MQIISNEQTGRNETVQDSEEFNSKSLATQAKKGEQLVYMMPATKKSFDLMGDDIVDLTTESIALRKK